MKKKMQTPIEDTIITYYKNSKKGLSIPNAFRNLLKDGHKVTLLQVSNVIRNHDLFTKGKKYKEQTGLFLKTVGSIHHYQADTFSCKQHKKSYVKFVALINVETRKAYVYHVPDIKKNTVIKIFNQWISEVPQDQYPTLISSDYGGEFNSKDFYDWLKSKDIRLFYVNKSQYKTSYATAIIDRFIRTIKDRLETYQQLNESRNIIDAMKEIVEGYNDTVHSVLGKTPNEMTLKDVEINTAEKRKHNADIMAQAQDKIKDKDVGVLVKKNKLDKGNKIRLAPGKHKVTDVEGYNIKLDDGSSYPPKDIVVFNKKKN